MSIRQCVTYNRHGYTLIITFTLSVCHYVYLHLKVGFFLLKEDTTVESKQGCQEEIDGGSDYCFLFIKEYFLNSNILR